MQRNLPATYDDSMGTWVMQVPFALPAPALRKAMKFIEALTLDRLKGAIPGDKKDRLGRALKAIQSGKIQQCFVGRQGDIYRAPQTIGKVYG